jgi:D-alanyl-D-alanine-carboxypeptidase/D-alanyl-D-alanine-endopeptidase
VKLALGTLAGSTRILGGADEKTIFRVGSISKLFTSAALVRMVEQDAVRLDDPVGLHLPTFDLRGWVEAPMLVRHLATHTSGLRDPMYPGDDGTLEGFARAMSTVRPASAPESFYSYSDVGMSLLGNMLAAAAGKPFGDLVRDLVCQPLGMSDTVLELDKLQAERLLVGHQHGKPVATPTSPLHAPTDGYYSTVWDLLKFVAAQGQEPDSIAHQTWFTRESGSGVGLGWHINTLPHTGKRLLWHNGSLPGYRSYLAFAPATGCGVVALTNSDRPTEHVGMQLLDKAVGEVDGT